MRNIIRLGMNRLAVAALILAALAGGVDGAVPTVAYQFTDGVLVNGTKPTSGQALGNSGGVMTGLNVQPLLETTAVSGAGTAACSKWYVVTTGTGFTHTLPAASDACMICWKKDNDTDAVVLARAGSDVIDGATSLSLTVAYQTICLRGRSGNWDVN